MTKLAHGEADGLPLPRRYLAIAAISCGNIVTAIDSTIANVALPTIGKALQVNDAETVLVVTAYQIVLLATLLPFSALGDRLGHRRMFMLGQALFALATGACLAVDSLPALVAVRCLQALGSAASISVSSALLRETYPRDQLGRGIGFNTMVVTASLAASPPLSGLILSLAGWQWLFAAELPLAVLALLFIPALPAGRGHSQGFDWHGAILCAAALGLFGAGEDLVVHGRGLIGPLAAAALMAGGAGLGYAMFRRSAQDPRPMIPVDLFRNRQIGLTLLALVGAYGAAMVMMLALPFLLSHGYHFTPLAVGAAMGALPVGMMLGSPLGGFLSDRFSPALLGTLGVATAALAVAVAGALATVAAPPPLIAMAGGIAMGGFGFCYTASIRLILSTAPRDRAAVAGSVIATTRFTGQLVGASAVAALLAARLGATGLPLLAGAAVAAIATGLFVWRNSTVPSAAAA